MQCNTCKAELRWDEPRECWTCDVCRPSDGEPKPKFSKGAVPEVLFAPEHEAEIRRICKEEFERMMNETTVIPEEKTDWRGDAKKLGISLYDKELSRPRKKEDVLKDIELKSQEDNNETP
jgi:hypothetical protein